MNPRDALAAEIFPREWREWATKPGLKAQKKRQKLRKDAEDRVALRALRAAGRSCASCRSFRKLTGPGATGEWICDAYSDHEGDAITTADDLCLKWHERVAP